MKIKDLGGKVAEMLEGDLKDFLAEFTDEDKENLKILAKVITAVAVKAVTNKEIDQEMAHINAVILNYESAVQAMLTRRLSDYLEDAFDIAKKFVIGQLALPS